MFILTFDAQDEGKMKLSQDTVRHRHFFPSICLTILICFPFTAGQCIATPVSTSWMIPLVLSMLMLEDIFLTSKRLEISKIITRLKRPEWVSYIRTLQLRIVVNTIL